MLRDISIKDPTINDMNLQSFYEEVIIEGLFVIAVTNFESLTPVPASPPESFTSEQPTLRRRNACALFQLAQ